MRSKNENLTGVNPKITLIIITAVIFSLLASGCTNKFKSNTITKQESITTNNDSKVTKETTSNVNNSVIEPPVEIVNTIENEGNPIQLVLNVGSLNSPIYVKLGQTTEVTDMETRLFIYLKNKDLLSYEDSVKLKKPRMVVTVKPSNCTVFSKNPLVDPNSFNCSIDIQSSPNRSIDVSIEEIYDKDARQILKEPVTFKLKLEDESK